MPKVIDHEQRRSDIIDVTWGLIVAGGIESATMREIAAGAGFANGALKHYFPGKDDIIQGTYDRALGMMGDRVDVAVEGKSGLEALRAMCYASAPLDPEGITAARVLLSFWERAVSNDELHEAYRVHLRFWRASLADYIEQGRADGDIVTATATEQLVDEIVLLNVGSNIMSLIGPELSSVAMQERHLASFLERLTQP